MEDIYGPIISERISGALVPLLPLSHKKEEQKGS